MACDLIGQKMVDPVGPQTIHQVPNGHLDLNLIGLVIPLISAIINGNPYRFRGQANRFQHGTGERESTFQAIAVDI